MRIVALGDTHGRVIWKEIIDKEKDADKIIFIGDYFDSRESEINGYQEIDNFKAILAYKVANPDKVVLLLGNHDFHYISERHEQYSGYQPEYSLEIGELVNGAIRNGHMQLAHLEGKYLFTHAGLTKTWFASVNDNQVPPINDEAIQTINDLLVHTPNKFNFTVGRNQSWTGDDITQSPIWVRPSSLLEDMVDDVICVVGHTNVGHIVINPNNPLLMIDVLGETSEYLVVEDGIAKVGTL